MPLCCELTHLRIVGRSQVPFPFLEVRLTYRLHRLGVRAEVERVHLQALDVGTKLNQNLWWTWPVEVAQQVQRVKSGFKSLPRIGNAQPQFCNIVDGRAAGGLLGAASRQGREEKGNPDKTRTE